MVDPSRRVPRKGTPTPPVRSPGQPDEPASSSTSLPAPVHEPPVNDYLEPDSKRQRQEPQWVENLYLAAAQVSNQNNLFTLIQEAEDQCEFMKIEFSVEAPTSNRQRKLLERSPVAYMVKKMRDAEVSLAKLAPRDRLPFVQAKAKEVDSFIKNEAVRRCLDSNEIRKAYDSKRIVRARWVLTWKLTPPEDLDEARRDAVENPKTVFNADGTRKAKARIVLLGFEHPSLLDPNFKTSSPVQSSMGRNLLYSMSVHHQWPLEGLDLATAFLQTQATEADQELWTTGVEELRQALGVGSEGILRILRNIYGSTTAPRGLWLDLHKTLTNLGAQAALGERCLWVWLSKERMDGNHPLAIGAMGGHVDDFHRIGDGSPEWLAIKAKIDAAYKWGTVKKDNYRHAGMDILTIKDSVGFNKIVIDQDFYVETLQDVDISPERLRDDGPLSRGEVAACRASLGALQWLATQSQPQLCARCNLLLTDLVTVGTTETAREIQELIGEVRREPFKLSFVKFSEARHWTEVVVISMGDQAHNNRPRGDSTGGLVTLLAGPECLSGKVCAMNLISWRTWKLKRKAISSNDAEVQSVLEAEDSNFRARLLWTELHGAGGFDVDRPLRRDLVEQCEQQVLRVKGVLCTDSRGGYDAVEVNESPLLGLSNVRAALQAFQLRSNLRRAAGMLRWLASDYDLADALTKKRADCRIGLIKFLRSGLWCIKHDPSFTSAKKGKKVGKSAVEAVDRHVSESSLLTSFGGWCNMSDSESEYQQ